MKEIELKYGCNPNQKPARIFSEGDLPITILNGNPGYINLLDALNGYQLVKELKEATNYPAAASFKHVSPAGVGIGLPLNWTLRRAYFAGDDDYSDIACAYIRARGADRMSSFGDMVALSDVCDISLANYLAKEVSDGIIATGYTKAALEVLKKKKKGNYVILQIDPDYKPKEMEYKTVYGITFEQKRNDIKITPDLFKNIVTKNKDITKMALLDMTIAMITLKYSQSNSICYAKNGSAIGIGAGGQSRIHCTRLAGNKADNWFLRMNERVIDLPFKQNLKRPIRDNVIDEYISGDCDALLDNYEEYFTVKPEIFSSEDRKEWLEKLQEVTIASDAYFPFGDNIKRAYNSGVKYVVETGGSLRDDEVILECDKRNMVMVFTDVRLFHH